MRFHRVPGDFGTPRTLQHTGSDNFVREGTPTDEDPTFGMADGHAVQETLDGLILADTFLVEFDRRGPITLRAVG